MSTIARNSSPDTIAGIAPALATIGRSDMQAGCAAPIWNHDPESSEEVIANQKNSARNILNARNAAIAASDQ